MFQHYAVSTVESDLALCGTNVHMGTYTLSKGILSALLPLKPSNFMSQLCNELPVPGHVQTILAPEAAFPDVADEQQLVRIRIAAPRTRAWTLPTPLVPLISP